jgi:hypothetical protein
MDPETFYKKNELKQAGGSRRKLAYIPGANPLSSTTG